MQIAYVDQSRESLDPDKTVYEEITGGVDLVKVGDREVHGRAYVAGLNFKGSDQQKRVGDLSGGERNRLHLAKALLMGGNVLLLDEPTNDLDVDTLRALEEALLEFPGCAVVISHDRWFLDRIATHVLAFEGDSQVTWFEGNFSDYEKDRHQAPRRRRRPAAPPEVQAADALSTPERCSTPASCLVSRRGPGRRAADHAVVRDRERRARMAVHRVGRSGRSAREHVEHQGRGALRRRRRRRRSVPASGRG